MKRMIRVLLIEDDQDDVLIVRESLRASEAYDFEVACVDKLAVGLDRLEHTRFDVVLLDLSLPDSQGIDTFVELYSFRIGVPIIVLTGLHDNEMALRMMRLGAQGYLVKGRDNLDLLPLAIQYAIEQFFLLKEVQSTHLWEKHDQVVQQLIASWPNGAAPPPDILAHLDGLALPVSEMIREYQTILEHLCETQAAPLSEAEEAATARLSVQLAEAQAGPRDVLALHLAALKGLCEFSSIRQGNLYVETGHVLLIKLLGNLLQQYQDRIRTRVG